VVGVSVVVAGSDDMVVEATVDASIVVPVPVPVSVVSEGEPPQATSKREASQISRANMSPL